jgi:predicted nucleotidyltransferase
MTVNAGLPQQQRIVDAATRWAEQDRRVRALVLKGSLARGEADERSDVDLVVVAEPGCLEELWATRRSIAESLGGWLGGFDEVAWQAPHTFIGICSGPVKVDFFFQDGQPAPDPWLSDGHRVLFGPAGLADSLRESLAAARRRPDLDDFDSHAWDWLWAMHVKLRRPGEGVARVCRAGEVRGNDARICRQPPRGGAVAWRLADRSPAASQRSC